MFSSSSDAVDTPAGTVKLTPSTVTTHFVESLESSTTLIVLPGNSFASSVSNVDFCIFPFPSVKSSVNAALYAILILSSDCDIPDCSFAFAALFKIPLFPAQH